MFKNYNMNQLILPLDLEVKLHIRCQLVQEKLIEQEAIFIEEAFVA